MLLEGIDWRRPVRTLRAAAGGVTARYFCTTFFAHSVVCCNASSCDTPRMAAAPIDTLPRSRRTSSAATLQALILRSTNNCCRVSSEIEHSEAAVGQAATHAVRAEVGEARSADRATGAAAGRTGSEPQLRTQQLRTRRPGCSGRKRRYETRSETDTPSRCPNILPRETHKHRAEASGLSGLRRRRCEPLGEDVSEMLEYVPAQFQSDPACAAEAGCASCERIVQAQAPSRPIERGLAGPGLLAHVLVSKYCDHLPLYRQAEIYAREGVELERSTLADWVGGSEPRCWSRW